MINNILFKEIILLFFFINIIIKYEKKNYFKIKKEIRKLKKYYIINEKGILINSTKFKQNDYPKVSIVSAVYNRAKFLLRFLRSIQNQQFNNIEIIFVDDCSDDNSVQMVEKYRKEDKRIILLKQKKNKGTLFSRNIGALKSKGEYLIFPDPDDILSEDILSKCYEIAKKNNFEMIRFNMYSKYFFPFNLIQNNLPNIIYQPYLRTHLIYGLGYEKLIDGIISNKFIKRTTFIITLNNINKFYLNQNMIYFEDGLINFALHFNAKSLFLYQKIGYYYIFNKDSVSRSLNYNIYFKCYFLYLKFLLENIKNKKYEKKMIIFLLNEYIHDNNLLFNIKETLKIYEEVINILLNFNFISDINKQKLLNIKKIILKKNF